jgi:hypothetical protein
MLPLFLVTLLAPVGAHALRQGQPPPIRESPVFAASLAKKLGDWQQPAGQAMRKERTREGDEPRLALLGTSGAVSLCVASGCLYSGCLASACLYSGCLGSACSGSGCLGSGCYGSACGGSGCVGSGCVGSACNNSVCTGSGCVVSFCYGSACVGSGCTGSFCVACSVEPVQD